jgi:hypothetical protein
MSFTVFVIASKPEVVNPFKRKVAPKPHPVEKNPLVSFYYPNSKDGQSTHRMVRLIGANRKHYIGVEVTAGKRAHFKKFLRCNATYFIIHEYNPESVK